MKFNNINNISFRSIIFSYACNALLRVIQCFVAIVEIFCKSLYIQFSHLSQKAHFLFYSCAIKKVCNTIISVYGGFPKYRQIPNNPDRNPPLDRTLKSGYWVAIITSNTQRAVKV